MALAVLLLILPGCDGTTSGPEAGCLDVKSCDTLDGLSDVRETPYSVSSAVATDSLLYVALTSLTRRFDPTLLNPDEVFVLTRPIGPGSQPDTSRGWSLQQVSDSPDRESGGPVGWPVLQWLSHEKAVSLVWGELRVYGTQRHELMPERILEATWTKEARPSLRTVRTLGFPPRGSLGGGRLLGSIAYGSSQRLHTAYREAEEGFGRVAFQSRFGPSWNPPSYPTPSSTISPSVATTTSGTLLLTYLRIRPQPTNKGGLFFQKSSDDGQRWSPPVKVADLENTNDRPTVRISMPRIVEGNRGTYHVFYAYDLGAEAATGDDTLTDQIWHTVSQDGGSTWSVPQPVHTSEIGYAHHAVAVRGTEGHPHLFYYEAPSFTSTTGTRVRHARWNGSAWIQEPDLSNGPLVFQGSQGIAATQGPAGCIHVVWDEWTDREAETTRFQYRRVGCSS